MSINETLTLIALLLGPALGAWLAEHLSKSKSKNERRHAIFRALLANKSMPIALSRVESLNLLPYEFSNESNIITAWREYIDSTDVAPSTLEERNSQIKLGNGEVVIKTRQVEKCQN